MLPEIGATEWLVIAAVVLIAVRPSDLPAFMRKIGQFVGRLRGMASDFRTSFDEMARQSELDELRKEVAAMRSGVSPASLLGDNSHVSKTFTDIDDSLSGRSTYDPMQESALQADAEHETAAAPALFKETPAKPKRARKPKAAPEPAPTPEPVAPRKRAAPKAAAAPEAAAPNPPPAAKPRKTTKAKA